MLCYSIDSPSPLFLCLRPPPRPRTQDTIDELQEKLEEAEKKLLRSLEDVDALNSQLTEAGEQAMAAEVAAQQQVLALKQQMAAREQEIVAEKLAGIFFFLSIADWQLTCTRIRVCAYTGSCVYARIQSSS